MAEEKCRRIILQEILKTQLDEQTYRDLNRDILRTIRDEPRFKAYEKVKRIREEFDN